MSFAWPSGTASTSCAGEPEPGMGRALSDEELLAMIETEMEHLPTVTAVPLEPAAEAEEVEEAPMGVPFVQSHNTVVATTTIRASTRGVRHSEGDLVAMDAKKARRIMRNREAANRSRLRKANAISTLTAQNAALEANVRTLTAALATVAALVPAADQAVAMTVVSQALTS